MNLRAPGLEVEFDKAAGVQRQIRHHRKIRLLNGAVGFPANAHDAVLGAFNGDFRCFNGVQNLRGGVAPEITDARGFFVDGSGELFGRDCFRGKCLLFEMMVLAVETVKTTGMIEDRQVTITDFRTS